MTLLEVEPLLLNWESQEELLAAKTPFQSLKYQTSWRTRDYYVDLQYALTGLLRVYGILKSMGRHNIYNKQFPNLFNTFLK